MSKTIKLDEETYKELEDLLLPRETFSQAVHRLIHGVRQLQEALDRLSGKKRS